jgi:hypothetical protein
MDLYGNALILRYYLFERVYIRLYASRGYKIFERIGNILEAF